MRLEFWPTNPYSKSTMHYTGQFPVKYFIQQRLLRKKNSDSKYCAILLQYMREFACKFSSQALRVSVDDECSVPLDEPDLPQLTEHRAQNR